MGTNREAIDSSLPNQLQELYHKILNMLLGLYKQRMTLSDFNAGEETRKRLQRSRDTTPQKLRQTYSLLV